MDKVPEISIYGDSAPWLVRTGIKLLTLRLDRSKYADLQVGKNVVIRYDSGFDMGIVFSRQVKPLKDYSTAELLLDGYMSVAEAAEDLKSFLGYEEVTVNTPMLGIGITTPSHLGAYLGETSSQALFNTPLDQAVALPEFHHMFLPSYLWWAILKKEDARYKLTVSEWHDLLSDHLKIFDSEQLKQVRTVDASTKNFYKHLRHKTIREILMYDSTASPRYQSVVLCQPVSVEN